jgi:cation transport protein ChaC
MGLTREDLSEGRLEALIAELAPQGYYKFLSAEERRESLRKMLSRCGPADDVWLFGYGSLMWNPAIEYAERACAFLRGYHRRFALWTPLGRGTPDRPGLTLALERGGSCHGIAFRIEAAKVQMELGIVWSREMLSGAYHPRWVKLETAKGPIEAITFVINPTHERYAGRLPADRVAETLASAEGRLGTCREYLENTVAHLSEVGIEDSHMAQLLALVRRLAPAEKQACAAS